MKTSIFALETMDEAPGASTKPQELMDTYNTYSGYVMALVEVLIGMYMDKFVPVVRVFLHNKALFLLSDSSGKPRSRASRLLYSGLLAFLPVVLGLTNSSVKSLQAVQYGTQRAMIIDDMKKDLSVVEQIKDLLNASQISDGNTANDTILKNAIRQRAVPFALDRSSSCSSEAGGSLDVFNAHELASTSVIYGFIPRAWNDEAMVEPTITSEYIVSYAQATEARASNLSLRAPPFSTKTAYEMLVQGKMVIESAFGNSATEFYDCNVSDGRGGQSAAATSSEANDTGQDVLADDSNGHWGSGINNTRLCEGGVSSMFKMSDFYSRKAFRVEDLVRDAADVIGDSIPNIAHNKTTVMLATYDLTPQIHLETMEITVIMDKGVNFGKQSTCTSSNSSCEPTYSYAEFGNALCGSKHCAFADTSGTFPIQPEIGVMPYFVDCMLGHEQIHYSADFRGYYPDACTRANASSFLYGYSSYMTGKAFGRNPVSNTAYIVAPRRRITFTFAKVVWEREQLDLSYNAVCGDNRSQQSASGSKGEPNASRNALDCSGLSYQLLPSGRFLFAGKAALPNDALRATSFRSPIPLVQLNSPVIQVDGKPVTIERLDPRNFDFYNNSAHEFSNCSVMMDAFFKHIGSNNYFLEQPRRVMFTSFFYFLMQDAAVTNFASESEAIAVASLVKHIASSRLSSNTSRPSPTMVFELHASFQRGNMKLQGNLHRRKILVSTPFHSFYTTILGCGCICIATVVISCVPVRRVKYFTRSTTSAEQFVAMNKDAEYPNSVHHKMLLFPVTGDRVRFDDLAIELLVLTQVSSLPAAASDSIQAKEEDARPPEPCESESESSQTTTSDEIA